MAGNYLTLHTNDRVVVTTSRGNQEKWFDAEKNLWYKVFHTQIGVGNRLDGGRRRVKKYLWSFLRTAPAGAGQAVTCSTSGMGLRLK